MAKHILLLEKLKDGEAETTYAIVWPGDNPQMVCELSTYKDAKSSNYLFKYTDETGKTTKYTRNLSRRTKEEASDLIKRLLTQKIDYMAKALKTELCLLDNT